MENQNTQQQVTSADQAKKRNSGKGFSKAGLRHGIIATTFAIICLMMFGCASTSRPSTLSEIAEQEMLQHKLVAAQEAFQQKVDSATNEAQQKSDSILKVAEQK